jgi:hypothetical protein
MFTLGIFSEIWGCSRNVKVPSSSYKRVSKGTCKGIHNFWDEYRLSGIPCPLPFRNFCNFHAFVRETNVGDSIRFLDPQHWLPLWFLSKTTHDASIEKVQEEHAHWGWPGRSSHRTGQWKLSHCRTFVDFRPREESKTWSHTESTSRETLCESLK